MFSLSGLWRRHRRKVFVSLGVVGGGYALYKLYSSQRDRYLEFEVERERQREAEEIIKNQLQAHFEGVQKIADAVTLPHAVHQLRLRIAEELDLSDLRARLQQGKSHQHVLTAKERMDIWDKLKILSFTRTALSIWSLTMLTLYSRVQVNILGRHLYITLARGLECSQELNEGEPLDKRDQQEFLANVDYLSAHALSSLVSNMQKAATEILKEKRLTDLFNIAQLHETIVQILRTFADLKGSQYWLSYLLPDDSAACSILVDTSNGCNNSIESVNTSWLQKLMLETRTVLSGPDFEAIVDVSLNKVVDELMEDLRRDLMGGSSAGMPLARLLPKVAEMGPRMLEEPSRNMFIRAIGTLPQVELFYTLVYTNNPSS